MSKSRINPLIIRFYCVGKADTIILRWDFNKVGIIDCANAKKVLKYLDDFESENKVEPEIVFFIITHFHSDHIKGFPELWKTLFETRDQRVGYFFSSRLTMLSARKLITPDMNGNTTNPPKTMFKCLLDIKRYREQDYFQKTVNVTERAEKDFGDFSLRFHSPGEEEIEVYIEKSEKADNANGGLFEKKQPAHNFLSSVTMLVRKQQDEYCLFTGDAESTTLERLDKEQFDYVEPDKTRQMQLACAQVPHHGSIENWNEGFWTNRRIVEQKTEAVVSARGNENLYHPSPKLLYDLDKIGYVVMTTCKLPDYYAHVQNKLSPTLVDRLVRPPDPNYKPYHEYSMALGDD